MNFSAITEEKDLPSKKNRSWEEWTSALQAHLFLQLYKQAYPVKNELIGHF
jgi:hypothetical protein